MPKKNELDIQIPKSAPGAQIEVKNEKLFKLPLISVFTGQAGKGKTTAACNLIRMFGGKKPVIWALFDDCQGSKVFKHNSGLGKLVISHRHQGQFPEELGESPLGLSCIFTVQNFRDRADGIPRPVRTNSSMICVFFTRDQKEREAIAEEASGVTDPDTLIQRLDEVTKPFDPSFLLIDKSPINPESNLGVFRKCFDGPVDPPPEVSGQKKAAKSRKRNGSGNGEQEAKAAKR